MILIHSDYMLIERAVRQSTQKRCSGRSLVWLFSVETSSSLDISQWQLQGKQVCESTTLPNIQQITETPEYIQQIDHSYVQFVSISSHLAQIGRLSSKPKFPLQTWEKWRCQSLPASASWLALLAARALTACVRSRGSSHSTSMARLRSWF